MNYKAKVKNNGNHKFSGDWIEGNLIEKSVGTFIYCIERDDLGNLIFEKEIEVDPKTVCRDSGLVDKNGNKIFEHDRYKTQGEKVYKVYFKEGAFCGGLSENYCCPLGWEYDFEEEDLVTAEYFPSSIMEVIGSKFDKPVDINMN